MSPSSAYREELVRAWQRPRRPRVFLRPAAWAYRVAVGARRAAFRIGAVPVKRVSVPVVSIGNITVGGTGKTPAALWLASQLQAAGEKPAIVTRGYSGRLGGRTVTVGLDGHALLDVEEIGDEATLLAERFAGVVVCGADRVSAARQAIEQHGATVVILDDGFQHWRLARDLDIVLIDGRTGLGNGALLPAGPLREPPSALSRAGAIVVTKTAGLTRLAETLVRNAPGVPTFAADLVPQALVYAEEGATVSRPLGDVVGKRVVTVSGIAQPQSFYELLGQLDARAVEVLEYPDHHRYTQADWQRINQASRRADLVLCTEKDLVKLRRFPFARGRLVALRVNFVLKPRDEARLLALVASRALGLRPSVGHAS